MLLLSPDNTLQNVIDTDEVEDLKQDEVVQDYKKLIRRQVSRNSICVCFRVKIDIDIVDMWTVFNIHKGNHQC